MLVRKFVSSAVINRRTLWSLKIRNLCDYFIVVVGGRVVVVLGVTFVGVSLVVL